MLPRNAARLLRPMSAAAAKTSTSCRALVDATLPDRIGIVEKKSNGDRRRLIHQALPFTDPNDTTERVSRPCSEPMVATEKIGSIMMIELKRADKRNCVDAETARQLVAAVRAMEEDEQVLVGVLHGDGGSFSSGLDLHEVAEVGLEAIEETHHSLPGPMGPAACIPGKPMVAGIAGYAVAGGLELALMCDIRVIEEEAVVGFYNRRFGIPLIDGGTARLPSLIGLSRALDLILTGRSVTAKEAFDIGLCNRLVANGSAVGQAYVIATALAKYSQACLRADRKSAYYSALYASSFDDAMRYERRNAAPVLRRESRMGAQAFALHGIGKHGKGNFDKDTIQASCNKNSGDDWV